MSAQEIRTETREGFAKTENVVQVEAAATRQVCHSAWPSSVYALTRAQEMHGGFEKLERLAAEVCRWIRLESHQRT